jgi:hypothetical protein
VIGRRNLPPLHPLLERRSGPKFARLTLARPSGGCCRNSPSLGPRPARMSCPLADWRGRVVGAARPRHRALLRNQVTTLVAIFVWLFFIEHLFIDFVPDAGKFASGAAAAAMSGLDPETLLAPSSVRCCSPPYSAVSVALGALGPRQSCRIHRTAEPPTRRCTRCHLPCGKMDTLSSVLASRPVMLEVERKCGRATAASPPALQLRVRARGRSGRSSPKPGRPVRRSLLAGRLARGRGPRSGSSRGRRRFGL